MTNLRRQLASGFIWSMLGQIIVTMVMLITNIVLARLLGPGKFGQIAIVAFFLAFGNILVTGGLGGALVRLPKVQQEHITTVFTVNLGVSFFIYLVLCVSAKSIAVYYGETVLENLVYALGSIFLITPFQLINRVMLLRQFRYREKMKYDSFAIICASLLSLFSVKMGAGIWAIVIFQLSFPLLVTIQMSLFVRTKVGIGFNLNIFHDLFGFGINTTLSNLLNVTFNNINNLIIARVFSINQAGFYFQADKLARFQSMMFNTLTEAVLYPVLSKFQNNVNSFEIVFTRIIKMSSVILVLSSVLLINLSESIVVLLYGEQWISTAFYLEILIVSSCVIIHDNWLRMIFKVFNRTGVILKLELLKKLFHVIFILTAIYLKSMELLLFGMIVSNCVVIGMYFKSLHGLLSINPLYKHVVTVFLVGFLSWYLSNVLSDVIDSVGPLIRSLSITVIYILLSYSFRLIRLGDIKAFLEMKSNRY